MQRRARVAAIDRQPRVIAVLGCTASGKSALARELAMRLNGEIVSIDSMKVYRGMDVGTAKPTMEQRAAVRHHLIDVADPWESFSAARFVELADAAIAELHGRDKPAIVVGGSTLYFKALFEGLFEGPSADDAVRAEIRAQADAQGLDALHAELARVDPEAASRIHRNDLRRIERALEVHRITGRPISSLQTQWSASARRRPDWDWTLIGLRREREAANRRINERVRRMVDARLVEEARRIWADPRGVSVPARQAVGYSELFDHFEGRCDLAHAIERIKIDSRQLAKHQRTWLRRQSDLRWIDLHDGQTMDDLMAAAMQLVAL